ncbi:hypothetical protein FRACA_1520006 [Frankia canadensis]|uniref:Transposase IS200-like domain-containing protein n=1 Tax=Frankia canadensis TaxID=1836972 RepID=A0A2I2KM32_9ACTN|nr:hypothetical protein FRACA_1520006 [Frankia canadensis]SOU54017.1 hypothetical protein FRACA_1520006 [Frankia canadensis]
MVFLTKYRRDVFDTAMLDACQRTMRDVCDVCDDLGARLVEFNGEDDHVHLLVEYPPKVAVSTLVNSLKGHVRTDPARRAHRPGEPRLDTRAFLVPAVPRGIRRRRPDHAVTRVHRQATATSPDTLTPP